MHQQPVTFSSSCCLKVLPSAKYTRSLVIDIIGLDFHHGLVARTSGSPRAVAQRGGSGSDRAASRSNDARSSDAERGLNKGTSDGSPTLAKAVWATTPSRLFLSMEMATKSSAKFSSVVEFRKGPSDAWEPLQSQASGAGGGKSGSSLSAHGTNGNGRGGNKFKRLKVLLEYVIRMCLPSVRPSVLQEREAVSFPRRQLTDDDW